MRLGAIVVLVLAFGCRMPASSSRSPTTEAPLAVTLFASEDNPTAVRLEVANPHDAIATFCPDDSPFEGLRADVFVVLDADGNGVPYEGPLVKRSPPEDADCFAVEPSRFHIAEVDLADAYTLPPGTYEVRFRGGPISRLPSSGPITLVVE